MLAERLLAWLLFCAMRNDVSALKGHLQPLGLQWEEPTVFIPELQVVPQPRQFYEEFVKPRQPVVFRGEAFNSPASKLWDPEYLEKEYGDYVVRLEARHEQDQSLPVTPIGFARDTIRHFARNFKQMNAYVISQIPSPMEKDVFVPACMRCGNIARSIQDVHLFITARGGKTALHRDPYSNVHCVFNGTKDWIVIENKYEDQIYQSIESENEFGGFSTIDVDSVDLEQYPNVKDVEHAFVTLNSGDCIYMPASYWHQVRVNGEYNTAVSIWFSRDFKAINQDWSNCLEEEYSSAPLSDVDVLWRFSGKNESLSQGRIDIHLLRALMLSMADQDHVISIPAFCDQLIGGDPGKKSNVTEMRRNFALKLGNGSDHVTADHVRSLSVDDLKKLLETIEQIDVANTVDFEYTSVQVEEIKAMIISHLRKNHVISKTDFVRDYVQIIGGSKPVAEEVFAILDPHSSGFATPDGVKEHLSRALHNFTSARDHDPTIERLWVQHLRARDEL